MEVFAGRGDDIRIGAGGRGPGSLPSEVGVELVALLDRARVGDLDVGAEGLELDAILRQQELVAPQTVNKVTLGNALLPPPGRLGWHDAAVDAGPDAVGAWLLLVTAHLALLAEDAAVAAGDLDDGGVGVWRGIGNRGADRGGGLVVGRAAIAGVMRLWGRRHPRDSIQLAQLAQCSPAQPSAVQSVPSREQQHAARRTRTQGRKDTGQGKTRERGEDGVERQASYSDYSDKRDNG